MNHQISKNTKPLFKNRKICKIIVQLSLIMFWKSYFLFFKDNSKPCRHVPFVWRRWQSVRVLYKNQRHWPSTLRTWPSQDSQIGAGPNRWTLCVYVETKTAVGTRNRLRILREKKSCRSIFACLSEKLLHVILQKNRPCVLSIDI